MAWFFIKDGFKGDFYTITGEDANHISKSLRMHKGETLTLCTEDGKRHECIIESISLEGVKVKKVSSTVCEQEPSVRLSLFVAMLKGDKMDDVIQKSVELGVHDITPVLTKRCISRPDGKSLESKIRRWQKISDNAASQSRRGIIPKINPCLDIKDLFFDDYDLSLVFYECGGEKIRDLYKPEHKKIAVITGCEGGFEEEEIIMLENRSVKRATLGKRILRAQTAPLAALSILMYESRNME